MVEVVNDAACRWQNEAYWPWPIALAHCQQLDARQAAFAAACEVIDIYSRDKTFRPFMAMSAVERVMEEALGQDYEEGAAEVFFAQLLPVENRLLGPVRAGQVVALGRRGQDVALSEIPVTDWVGCEVDCGQTSDLIREGWRQNRRSMGAKLGEETRQLLWSDLHLPSAAVRQLAESLDARDVRANRDDWLSGDFAVFEGCERRAGAMETGYWSPLVTGAWIVSRSRKFTAAAQIYEIEQNCERGGVFSSAAYLVVGDMAGQRFGATLSDALNQLRLALEAGTLKSGVARDSTTGNSRSVEHWEWADWRIVHDHRGVSLVPGLYSFKWPAPDILAVFPEMDRGGGPGKLAVTIESSESSAPDLSAVWRAWAVDAVQRDVRISGARKDALAHLGEQAPKESEARELIRTASEAIGRPIKRGRPEGSKSFANWGK